MCGGVLGEMFKGVDDVANQINPMHHFTQWATDNTIGKVPGVGKPLAQLGDWGNNHPAEVAAMAGAGYGAWELGAEYLGAGAAGGGADAGVGAAEGATAGAGAGSLDVGMTGAAASDAELSGLGGPTAGGFGGAGVDAAVDAGAGAAGSGGWLSSLFGGAGKAATALSTGKNALGTMQILSSLYGMEQQRKLSKGATAQSYSKAGAQAVQRSMAAQGYQGSGNMMTALSKYGADAYGANLPQQQASLNNTMGGLGLLTAGLGNLSGWGGTKP